MVDGVVLLVDASEGPMSQTKFVLSRAIAASKPAIVVLNKIDREGHRAEQVEEEIFDLFCALTSENNLLDYPLLYASARQGWVTKSLNDIPGKEGVVPLLETIIERIPPARLQSNVDEPFAMSVNTIQSDDHLGRISTGLVERGKVKLGDKIKVISREGDRISAESKVTKLFYLEGLRRVDVTEAYAGEIISMAGAEGGVTDTICDPSIAEPLKTIPISPPVISMTVGPNDSPLAGKEGSKLTSSMIKERLNKEIENNVTLSLKPSADVECIDLQGRGELQIGILVETLRREGFELTISPPKVLAVVGEDGVRREPIEEVTVDVDPTYQGVVIETLSNRKGNLLEFKEIGDRIRLLFEVPSRGMMGFRYEITNATRGSATVNSIFKHYDHVDLSAFSGLKKGKLVSMDTGKATGYALTMIAERGQLFVEPGEEVYEGMVIGENAKTGDLDVNPTKMKKLSNVRSTGAEEKVSLQPPIRMTIESIISYLNEDEVLEVTPKSIRLRKRILDSGARARWVKAHKPTK